MEKFQPRKLILTNIQVIISIPHHLQLPRLAHFALLRPHFIFFASRSLHFSRSLPGLVRKVCTSTEWFRIWLISLVKYYCTQSPLLEFQSLNNHIYTSCQLSLDAAETRISVVCPELSVPHTGKARSFI
jgi:hypothetical protein